MDEPKERLVALRQRLVEAEEYLRIPELKSRQPELESAVAEPGLWDDPDRAKAVQQEFSAVTDDLAEFEQVVGSIEDAETLVELSAEEDDDSVAEEVQELLAQCEATFDKLELRSLFSGEYDERDAVCAVQSGEGGTDAQDWAEMLLRMYQRWAEGRGFSVTMESVNAGTEAGISSAEFTISGRYAYGLLQSENGVHRLVRMSPFNKDAKRQTAFAAMSVVPFIEAAAQEVDIDEKDLRIDTYRSSGAGGQHVNVTDSAVRITHLPTNIVVSCQNERSQHQNKDRAMQMLAIKLVDLERQKRDAHLSELRGDTMAVGFGSQIRSYVLAPYQMVKDLRSEHETAQVEVVLNGELDPFMEAFLRWRRASQLQA